MTNQVGPLAVGQDPTSSVILLGLRQLQVLPIRGTWALISADTGILPHILSLPVSLYTPQAAPAPPGNWQYADRPQSTESCAYL